MQGIAGAAGAGEKQTVDTRIGGQGHAGFPRALQQVEHAGRQAGVEPALDRQLGDFRRQLAGLEQHRVTRQQRRHNMAVGQVTREVVRAEHRDHTMGLVPQHGGGVGQRPALLAGALAVALDRDGDLVDHAGHFSGGLPQRLAGFLANAVGQLVGAGLQAVSEGFQHGNPLIQRTLRPGRERAAGGLHSRFDLGRGGRTALPDHRLGDRIERFKTAAMAVLPDTGDAMGAHQLRSWVAAARAEIGTARTWSPARSCRRLAVRASTTRVPEAIRAGAAVIRQSASLRLWIR